MVLSVVLAGCSGAASTPQIVYVTAEPVVQPTPQIIIVTPEPVAQPTPQVIYVTPAPIETPEPDPSGSGVIVFGRSYNTNTLRIIGPAKTFKTSSKLIAWSAEFNEPAGDTTLRMLIASRNKAGIEVPIYSTDFEIANPAFEVVADKDDLASFVDRKPGMYVMRCFRGSTILAEGTFTLV